jgi:hypothetical protein
MLPYSSENAKDRTAGGFVEFGVKRAGCQHMQIRNCNTTMVTKPKCTLLAGIQGNIAFKSTDDGCNAQTYVDRLLSFPPTVMMLVH